jgi:hypothetical protein
MADISSELPIRTQLPGQANYDDVIVKLGDGTTPSQLASVDTHGSVQSKIADASGNVVTTTNQTTAQALDVNLWFGNALIDPRAIRALTSADVVTVDQGTSPWVISGTVTANQGGAWTVAATQSGAWTVAATQSGTWTVGLSEDHNYGTVGATTLRTAAQIGNATGAADFNFGAASAQTLRVAAIPGNASGIADFNNGATGAQTPRVAANLAIGGANVSATNPVPVSFSAAPLGTAVNDYKDATAIAAAASDNHDYAITSLKTFQGKMIWASASGLMKIEVQISADGVTFTSKWVGFNSTANPNISINLDEMVFLESGVGSKIRVICTNLDKKAMDLYSTISGTEV